MIHVYLAIQVGLDALRTQWAHSCCCGQDPRGCLRLERNDAFAAGKDDDTADQPILRFYDEQARPSSEFQTSGCNTPRMSQDTLGSSTRQSRDLV